MSYSLDDVVTLSLPCGKLLGAGSSGSVQSIAPEACLDGRSYALKTVRLPEGDLAPPELTAEILLHASLPACDAIVRYHFAWVHNGCYRILLERVEGELWDAVEAERGAAVSKAERISWARAILTAVAWIHGHGIAHRDVSPWNCFLSSGDGEGQQQRRLLKLGDFGLACRVPPSNNGGADGRLYGLRSEGCAPLDDSAIGSLYSAPELGSDEGYDPRQTDVFSAGMTLFAIWHAVVASGEGASGVEGLTGLPNMDLTGLPNMDLTGLPNMDLTDCVERLKAYGQFPPQWPNGPMTDLVRAMTHRIPAKRPCAAECVELLRLALEPSDATPADAFASKSRPVMEQVSEVGGGCFGCFGQSTGALRKSKNTRVAPWPTSA